MPALCNLKGGWCLLQISISGVCRHGVNVLPPCGFLRESEIAAWLGAEDSYTIQEGGISVLLPHIYSQLTHKVIEHPGGKQWWVLIAILVEVLVVLLGDDVKQLNASAFSWIVNVIGM